MTAFNFSASHGAPADEPSATKNAQLARILKLFRAAVPCAGGVVLATSDGYPVAHDLPPGADANAAAGEAARDRRALVDAARAAGSEEPASAFVETESGLALVVFVGEGLTFEANLAPDADRLVAEWTGLDLAASAGHVLSA